MESHCMKPTWKGLLGHADLTGSLLENFSASMEHSVMCFAHIPELFSLVEHLNAGPVEVNSCLAFQKDYGPK